MIKQAFNKFVYCLSTLPFTSDYVLGRIFVLLVLLLKRQITSWRSNVVSSDHDDDFARAIQLSLLIDPNVASSHQEDDDIARAIQLSLPNDPNVVSSHQEEEDIVRANQLSLPRDPNVVSSDQEDDDIARAIQLSLQDSQRYSLTSVWILQNFTLKHF